MSFAIIPPVLAIAFLGWIIWLAFKKKLRAHKYDILAGLFFFGVWALIYWWVINA